MCHLKMKMIINITSNSVNIQIHRTIICYDLYNYWSEIDKNLRALARKKNTAKASPGGQKT